MSAPPRTRIIDRGLFGKTLECSNYVDSEDISLPPLNEETKVNDEDDDKQSINESRKQDVFLLNSRGSTFTIRRKAKAIRIEKCTQCTIRVLRGTVASIEILRCKRVVVEVSSPVASIRVDDCDDTQIVANWAARKGYSDDSLPDGEGVGLQVIASGSHATTLVYPRSGEEGSSLIEVMLPETLIHTISERAANQTGGGVISSDGVVLTTPLKPGGWGVGVAARR
jgi:hypothetical protein